MTKRILLTGSERKPVPGASAVDTPDPNDIIDVTVLLRRRAPLPGPGAQPLKRADFAASYGADPVDVRAVESFAGQNDLSVREVDLARRSVVLSGTLANTAVAFGTHAPVSAVRSGLP